MIKSNPELRLGLWNIFLDRRFDQAARLGSIIATLQLIHEQTPFDVVGVLEAGGSNGKTIAQEVFGNDGIWEPHSRKSLDEHIGVMGPRVYDAEEVDIGYSKRALFVDTALGAVAFTHISRVDKRFPAPPDQRAQARLLLEEAEDRDAVAIGADWNSLSLQKPRRIIENGGYHSAYRKPMQRSPKTFPMGGYEVNTTPLTRKLLQVVGGLSIDDVYIKDGFVADSTVVVEGESDHGLLVVDVKEID